MALEKCHVTSRINSNLEAGIRSLGGGSWIWTVLLLRYEMLSLFVLCLTSDPVYTQAAGGNRNHPAAFRNRKDEFSTSE